MRRIQLALALLLTAACVAQADITNLTQGTTHPTIQDAIDQSAHGDEIVVDPGEYFENLDLLGRQITLRSQDPTDPAIVIATIINGGGGDTVIYCGNGETPDTAISGFVITNGYMGGGFGGGGMFIDEGSPTVTHCSFTENEGFAGGLFLFLGNPTIAHCSFSNNSGSGGGAMRLLSEATIVNCTFTNNSANEGGALILSGGNVTLTDCSFTSNISYYEAGAVRIDVDSPFFTNCSFTSNSAPGVGGAVEIEAGSPVFTNCSFTSNSGGEGGAVYISSSWTSSAAFTNCSFTNNSADVSGGGLFDYQSGADSDGVTLSDCRFIGNTAGNSGGGICLFHTHPFQISLNLTNCSFSGNSAGEYGGGLSASDYLGGSCDLTLSGCWLTGNTAGTSGGGIRLVGAGLSTTLSDSVICGNTPDQIDGIYTDAGGNAIGIYIPPPTEPATPCPEDINGDGVVDQADLGALLAAYGDNCP
jgi:predicted outer membrane repeat protein